MTDALRAEIADLRRRIAERCQWPVTARNALALAPRLADALEAVEAERDALARFKAWVHDYLNGKDIPHHPPGVHGAEGCRIGDRIDHLFARLEAAEREADRLRKRVAELEAALMPFTCILTKPVSEEEWQRAAAALEGRDDVQP